MSFHIRWLTTCVLASSFLFAAAPTLRPSLEENVGQLGSSAGVSFLGRANGYTLLLGAQAPVFQLHDGARITMGIRGVTKWPQPEAVEPMAQRSNYFRSADPKQWKTGIRHYQRVLYRQILPGVDLHFYGAGEALEYDFILAPGVDPAGIVLSFGGASGTRVDAQGNLEISAGTAGLRHRKPAVYQEDGTIIPAHIENTAQGASFRVGAHDRKQSLTIDPVVEMSTLFPGNGSEYVRGVAVDINGFIYATGTTYAPGLPVTTGAVGPTYRGGGEVFVIKLSADGKTVLAVTYLGGDLDESAVAIAIAGDGHPVVVGNTNSDNFPTSPGALKRNIGTIRDRSGPDGFAAKLSPSLSSLDFSTFIGGSNTENVYGLAIGPGGGVAVVGNTASTDFPVTRGAYRETLSGTSDGFLIVLTEDGVSAAYGTYIGGSGYDEVAAAAFSPSGDIVMAGTTGSTNFPTTEGVYQSTMTLQAPFLIRFRGVGPALTYSTFFSGTGLSRATDVKMDAAGNVYIAGSASGTSFPVTAVSARKVLNSNQTNFVAKFDGTLSTLQYSVLLSGSGNDQIQGIAVQPDGRLYAFGSTSSADFPTGGTPLIPNVDASASVAFLTYLSPDGAIVDSTFWNGANTRNEAPYTNTGNTFAAGLAIASTNTVVMAGVTNNLIFPVTAGASGTTPVVTPNNRATFISRFAFGSSCTYTVPAGPITLAPAGETATFTVAAADGCNWTAASGADWIETKLISPTQFTVRALASTGGARSARIYVAGKVITVNQASGCIYSVSPSSAALLANGGTTSISPTISAGCAWTPTFSDTWLRISPGVSPPFAGSTPINLDVDINYNNTPRTATVTLSPGVTVTFTQAASTCTYTVSPNNISIGANTPNIPVSVTTQAGCRWDWGLLGPAATPAGPPYTGSTTGTGIATLPVPANPGTTRTLRASVAGKVLVVTQYGSLSPVGNMPSLNPSPALNLSGSPQVVPFKGQDGDGNTNISRIYFLINSTPSVPAGTCHGFYERATNALFLYNDTLTALNGPLTPGSSGTVQNSQCTLFGVNTTVTAPSGGVALDLNLSLALKSPFQATAQSIFGWISDTQGNESGWVNLGAWLPLATSGPQVPSLVPTANPAFISDTQTVSMTARDANGYTDIKRVYFLLNNDKNVPANTCHGFYDRAANAFFLYSDGLGTLLGPLTPGGSGSLDNSQCSLSGATSTVALAAGTDLLLRFGFTRKAPANAQAANVYFWIVDTADTGTGWVSVGSWTAAAPPPVSIPEIVSATPTSPNGSPQTFTITTRDAGGHADISRIYFQIYSSSLIQLNSCHGFYDRTSNSFYLYNDTLSTLLGPVAAGAATSIENSQCIVNGATSTVSSASGTDLVLKLGMSLKSTYTVSTRKVYFLAQDFGGNASSWIQTSSWGAGSTLGPAPPTPNTATTHTMAGSSQPVRFDGQDVNGENDIQRLYFQVANTNTVIPNTCHGFWDRRTNGIYLYNDSLTTLLGPIPLGAPGILRNSQCEVNSANSSVYSLYPGGLTVQIGISLLNSYANSTKSVYGLFQDTLNTDSGWYLSGIWNVLAPTPQQPPTTGGGVVLTPTGSQQAMTFMARDGNGYSDINRLYFLINPNSAIPKFTCHGFYDRPSNAIYLYNDALDTLLGPLYPGVPLVLQNSQCAIDGAATRLTEPAGVDLILNINITLKGTFATTPQVVQLWAVDKANAGTGWQPIGSVTPPAAISPRPPVIQTPIGAPSPGFPSQQVSIIVTDPNGAADVGRVYFLLNSDTNIAGRTCHGFYDSTINGIFLYDDTLTTLLGPVAPNNDGIFVENSQCKVNALPSGTTMSGNILGLALQVRTLSPFNATSKNLYILAQDKSSFATGWVLASVFNPPVPQIPSLVSASPATPSGSPQKFTFRLRDPQGFADLRYAYFLVAPTPNVTPGVCYGYYYPLLQAFHLSYDNSEFSIGNVNPFNQTVVQNSQCSIDPPNTRRVVTSGTDEVIELGLTLKPPFSTTTQNVYMRVLDSDANDTGWIKVATWTP